MSEPYYSDGTVTLYLADARECTAWIEADVLVTDPPFGRGWRQGALKASGSDSHGGIAGDETTEVRDAILEAWGDRPAILFGDLMLPPPIGCQQVGVYRKPNNAGTRGTTAGWRRDIEAIYLLGGWPTGIGGRSSVIATAARSQGNPSSPQGKYGHPHVKPVDVMETLVGMCPPGAVIADPFAGSGSTLVAAKNLGRRAIGVEVDPDHCRTAARRLAQTCLDFGA